MGNSCIEVATIAIDETGAPNEDIVQNHLT